MGHCDAIVSSNINTVKCDTYGDVMSLFGYDYPDSLFLYLTHLERCHRYYHDSVDHTKKIPFHLDINNTYIEWYFSR